MSRLKASRAPDIVQGLLRGSDRWSWGVGPLCLALVLVIGLGSAGIYTQRQMILIAVYTLIVSGLNLSFGYGGELALGQVAVFATGAYTTGYLNHRGHTDVLLALILSVVAAGVLGIISGVPGVRLSGWSLAMTSFFLVMLIPSITTLLKKQTGGLLGLPLLGAPTILGHQMSTQGMFVFAILVAGIWLLIVRNLIVSRYGTALQLMRESPLLTQSVGLSLYRVRISAYLLGGLPAGAAGCIFAYLNGYLSPDAFPLSIAIAVLAASVVGGSDSVWGAPVGAAILVLGPLQTSGFEKYSVLIYGVFLLAIGVLLSSGLAGLGRRLLARLAPPPPPLPVVDVPSRDFPDSPGIPGGTLEVHGVSRAFGGVKAISEVDFRAKPGEVTAIMGANGAGKTTLLNAISGFIATDAGEMMLDNDSVHGKSAHGVAKMGVRRTFQTPLIPRDMTALQIVESGRAGTGRFKALSSVLRLPGFRHQRREDKARALEALTMAGLRSVAGADARSLPLGTRRLLEVVRAVAAEPKVLLLDEPAAGLDDESLAELDRLIRGARAGGATIVVVEHNVRFLLGIADTVYVMERGEVIASGTPAQVRTDPAVVASYFGNAQAPESPDVGDLPSTSTSTEGARA